MSLEMAYPGRGQDVQDEEWIRDVGANGWIAFTQNFNIWFVDSERRAIEESGARVFSLSTADLPGSFKAIVFGRWWLSMARRTRRPDPCFWRLHLLHDIKRDLP